MVLAYHCGATGNLHGECISALSHVFHFPLSLRALLAGHAEIEENGFGSVEIARFPRMSVSLWETNRSQCLTYGW